MNTDALYCSCALDAFDREQKWADDRGRFSQEIADRRRAEARVRGEELANRFNALKDEYELPINCR